MEKIKMELDRSTVTNSYYPVHFSNARPLTYFSAPRLCPDMQNGINNVHHKILPEDCSLNSYITTSW